MKKGPTPGAVRVATPKDAPALAAIYAPYVRETAISFETEPPDAAEMAVRMTRVGQAFPWLVYEEAGVVLGYAYGGPFKERAAYRWSTETTVYVAREGHRRGVGRALYSRLLPILALQGFHYAYGGITVPNDASVGLHEACGFRPMGVFPEAGYKFGAWRDVGYWGLQLSSPEGAPAEPVAFSEAIWSHSAKSVAPKSSPT